MTPKRFHSLNHTLATSDDMRITTRSDAYNGAWVVSIDIDGHEYAITQSATPYTACHWVAELRRLEQASA